MEGANPLSLRIYFAHPLMVGPLDAWNGVLSHAASLGFDTVLLASPFDPGPSGGPLAVNLMAVHDRERLDRRLGGGDAVAAVGALAGEASRHGLALMVDLAVDRVAASSEEARAFGDGRPGAPPTDPRVPPSMRGVTRIAFEGADAYVASLADWLARLARAGVAGFRCLEAHRVPSAVWDSLIGAARAARPGCAFLAWTPGLDFEERGRLARRPFDAAFSSIRWWDGREGWLGEEWRVQSDFPAQIGFPEAPFGQRWARALDKGEVVRRRMVRALNLAAAATDGLLVPMGFEFGAREPMTLSRAPVETFESLRSKPFLDLTDEVVAANGLVERTAGRFAGKAMEIVAAAGAPLTALLRLEGVDRRFSTRARVVLANRDDARRRVLDLADFAPGLGPFLPLRSIAGPDATLHAEAAMGLAPADVMVLEGNSAPMIAAAGRPLREATEAARAARLAIEAVTPAVDAGRFPVKRIVGEVVGVEADIFGDGHDPLGGRPEWRADDEEAWQRAGDAAARQRPLARRASRSSGSAATNSPSRPGGTRSPSSATSSSRSTPPASICTSSWRRGGASSRRPRRARRRPSQPR